MGKTALPRAGWQPLALVVLFRVLWWCHDHGPIAEELRRARVQIAEIPAALMLLHTVGHELMLGAAIEPESTGETGRSIEHPQDEYP